MVRMVCINNAGWGCDDPISAYLTLNKMYFGTRLEESEEFMCTDDLGELAAFSLYRFLEV